MRKSLLFIAALCATVAVKAETITLEPGENKIEAVIPSLSDGDVIELQAGTYTEWHPLTFTTEVTVKAAEGATPIVKINKWIITKDFEANGIEFTNLGTDYMLRTNANLAGTITLKNCYMHDSSTPFIYLSSYNLDNLVIDNCVFANNTRNEYGVINASGTIANFEMRNSTISKITGKYAVQVKTISKAVIDHCTIYDCGKHPLLIGEGNYNADQTATIDVAVSNCVISNPTEVEGQAIACYGGTADNCVWNNTAENPRYLIKCTNVVKADPQFTNPANGDFNFSVFSPLCFAATDGRHIGDPRWEAQSGAGIDLPTDATPVVLDKANVGAVSSDMTYYGDDAYFDFGPNDVATDTLRWAKWLVNVNKCAYSVSTELTSENGYKLVLDIIDPSTGAVVLTSDTAKTPSFKTIDFSGLEEGTYILRLKNRQGWSKVKVKSLTFTYTGGAEVNLPGTLPNEDAILGGNDKVKVDEEGYICFSGDGNVPNCFAKWNANFTKKGEFEVSLSVATTNGHQLAIQVLDGENVISETTPKWLDASGNLVLGIISVPQQGNYTIKFINTLSSSAARVKDITLTYAGGGIVEIPGTLLPVDAILSEKAFIDNDTIIFAPRGAEGYTPNGWAKWNVTLEDDALCSFKANCYRFSSNTMKIKISVIDADNDTIYRKEESVGNSGNSEVSLGSALLEAGDYVIQMQNTVKDSRGRLMSVVVTAQPIITITDDSDIDFTDYAGQMVTVQLMRTFKANMWNPICLPFGVEHSKLQSILNCETSYLLNNASLENQKLFVELAASQYNDIYNGSPYMIKPSEDVENPIFENVKIMETPHATATEKGPLTLRGSFESKELSNPSHVLLVGANNTLFFPSDEHPYIKSMRAYFILKDVEPSQMPRFAAFVEPGNAPTEMIIVGGEAERQKGHRKVLVDGQIRIQHEGKCYSILGLER